MLYSGVVDVGLKQKFKPSPRKDLIVDGSIAFSHRLWYARLRGRCSRRSIGSVSSMRQALCLALNRVLGEYP